MTALLTIFSIPKPFTGLAATQQRNAVQSWRSLGSDVEVLLFGDEEGIADAAVELGARHQPAIARSEFGTPLVSDAFAAAARLASTPLLCYVNADIILLPEFLAAVKKMPPTPFLMCGRRTDLDLPDLIDFTSPSWQEHLRGRSRTSGKLQAPDAMDYFVFPRTLVQSMPPFAVGRPLWDNWLLFYARRTVPRVVDATPSVMVVHQNHNYGHVQGGVTSVWWGPEGRRNRLLGAEMLYPFTIDDANWQLTSRGISRKTAPRQLLRQLQAAVALRVRRKPAARTLIRRLLRADEATFGGAPHGSHGVT